MSFVIQRVEGRAISLVDVRNNVLRIGRGTNAELRSENPAVALEHAVIEKETAGYAIRDRGSITGTYVNGKPVESTMLAKGDVIEIGDLRIEVQLADPTKKLFLRYVIRPKRAAVAGVPNTFPEEDYEPDRGATPGAGAIKARKVDYVDAFRLRRPWLTKISLASLALVVALAVVGEVTRPEKQEAFMPGGISSAHARARDAKGQPIGSNCQACHTPWNSVSDERCAACHTKVVHSENEESTPACGSCHNEHRGLPALAMVDDGKCTSCHADLPAATKKAVLASLPDPDARYDRAAVKKITGFGVDHPEFRPPADPNNIKFNHKLHLKKGGVRNGVGKLEELKCRSCHDLAVVKGKADPVALNFEAQCQSCHRLTFDPRLPTVEVPHGGDPDLVYGFVLASYAGNRDIIGKSSEEVRRILTRGAVTTPDARAVLNAEQVIKTKCTLCHAITRAGGRVVAQAPKIRTDWLPGAKFTHTQHKNIDCESCHHGVRNSVNTADVLMPKSEDCTDCHGPRRAATAAAVPKTASNCITCHEYHLSSKPLMSGMAPAFAKKTPGGGPGPGPAGGEVRMIDTILILAIGLLLLVVLIPVGAALYQKMRAGAGERAPAAPARAAAPPPPAKPAAAAPPMRAPEPAPAPRPAPAAAAPAAPAPAPPRPQSQQPAMDATRIASADDLRGGGAAPVVGGTEVVQWYGMLTCTAGPLEGKPFIVEDNGFYIGRDAQFAEVVIPDARVSKRHVRIVPRDGKVWAIDQNSTNGTFLGKPGGERITEVQLKRGDTLVLADGAATFTYQI